MGFSHIHLVKRLEDHKEGLPASEAGGFSSISACDRINSRSGSQVIQFYPRNYQDLQSDLFGVFK